MALQRGIDGPDPVRPEPVGGTYEVRPARSTRVASGTLACPHCDAPVSPGPFGLSPVDLVGCPYCGHAAAARDFLSLAAPTRPARVVVRIVI